jgi:hypothetical protein
MEDNCLFLGIDGGILVLKEIEKINQIIDIIHKNLSPDLLQGKWKTQTNPLEGHCYIASESLWHLLDKENYQPYCATYYDETGRCTHWWLVHKYFNIIADPTSGQYLPEKPPYNIGRKANFLTKHPSKRAKILIDRVNNINGN